MIRLRSSVSISILVHILFAWVCYWMMTRQSQITAPHQKLTWIELEPTPSEKKVKEDESLHKQIVQTERGKLVEHAAKDAYLGEKTQIVDRETVSKEHSTIVGKVTAPSAPTVKNLAPPEKIAPVESARAKVEAAPLSKFGLPVLPKDAADPAKKVEPALPRWANEAEPGAPLHDYVKGLKDGESTALNTREFVFYGYFHRIRERLDRAWVPILRDKLVKFYRSGRTLAADAEHTTRVLVVLNAQGEITKVQIMSESGNQMLDDAAVKAFNRAGPFPNPPKGIVDANREIQIPWEFVLRT